MSRLSQLRFYHSASQKILLFFPNLPALPLLLLRFLLHFPLYFLPYLPASRLSQAPVLLPLIYGSHIFLFEAE